MFDVAKAINAQKVLSNLVRIERLDPHSVDVVAGVDVGYKRGIAKAVAVAFSIKENRVLCSAQAEMRIDVPYIPGLLAFREAGPMMFSLIKLRNCTNFSVVFVNGHGLAHPRRFGIASHIGVVMNIPSIGVAKSLLYGYLKEVPGNVRLKELHVDGSKVGYAVKTAQNETYISVGHRVDPEGALELALRCWDLRNRFPEPIRIADMLTRS